MIIIEELVRNYLGDHLDVEVVCERDGQSAPFVLLERTGSGEVDRILRATIAMQSYGSTLLEAIELNERVKAVARELRSHDKVFDVKLNSDYNFTDTTTKEYRYQAVFDIYFSMEE